VAVGVDVDRSYSLSGDLDRQGLSGLHLCSRPQLQKTMPVATAALPVFRKSRRVVMRRFLHIFLVCFHGHPGFRMKRRTGRRLGSYARRCHVDGDASRRAWPLTTSERNFGSVRLEPRRADGQGVIPEAQLD